jgi:hypothetical protein
LKLLSLLDSRKRSKVYKVKHVIHTGFGTNHAAEIYVIEADDLIEYLKNPFKNSRAHLNRV